MKTDQENRVYNQIWSDKQEAIGPVREIPSNRDLLPKQIKIPTDHIFHPKSRILTTLMGVSKQIT